MCCYYMYYVNLMRHNNIKNVNGWISAFVWGRVGQGGRVREGENGRDEQL